MIIFMVLMGGLIFIGLVMTIIAVWPGYTPVGGNPLKIAGPILLGVGGECIAKTSVNYRFMKLTVYSKYVRLPTFPYICFVLVKLKYLYQHNV